MISYGYVKETKIYRAIYHHIAQDFIPLLTCHQLWCWLSPKTGDYFVLFKIHRAFYFSFFFYATKSCQIIKCRCPFLNNHKKAYAFTTQRKSQYTKYQQSRYMFRYATDLAHQLADLNVMPQLCSKRRQ